MVLNHRSQQLNRLTGRKAVIQPDIDGLTAIRMLCRGLPGTRVVVISSCAPDSPEANEARKFGAIDVVPKPVNEEDLRSLFARERQVAISTSAGNTPSSAAATSRHDV